jgi:hypothetical protein
MMGPVSVKGVSGGMSRKQKILNMSNFQENKKEGK